MATLHIPAGNITLNIGSDEYVLAIEAAIRDVLSQRPCVAVRFGDGQSYVSALVGPSSGMYARYEAEEFPELSEVWMRVRENLATSGLLSGQMLVPGDAEMAQGAAEEGQES